MGMRNGKMKFSVKNMSRNDFVLGCVIPFFLFWGGILTPVVTDSLLVWISSLIPFYGFIIVSDNILRGKIEDGTFIASVILALISSAFLTILLFLCSFENETCRNVCRLGFVNVVPGFFILLFGLIDHLKFFCFFPLVVSDDNS